MKYRILAEDRICVVVSDRLLAQEFGKKKARVIKEMRETGDIGLLRRIPYLECLDTFRKKLEKSVAFDEDKILKIENSQIVTEMCKAGHGAMLFPLKEADALFGDGQSDVHIFPLLHEEAAFSFFAAYDKEKKLNAYEEAFIRMATDYLTQPSEETEDGK